MCRKCQQYRHNKNNCRYEVRCGRCSEEGHNIDGCSNPKKCYYCQEHHLAGNKECREYQYQGEISAIQSKEKATRGQARTILDRRNPVLKSMNYARAVQQTLERQQDQKQSIQGNEPSTTYHIKKTEAVCMSPQSGTLFTTTVEIPDSARNDKEESGKEKVDRATSANTNESCDNQMMETDEEDENREVFQRELQ